MVNYTALQRQLITHEAIRRLPYHDSVGKLTIGIGRNLDDVGITRAEALYLLDNDIEKVISVVSFQPYWEELNEVRQRVIIDMVFNLGWPRFSKFKKLIKALNDRNYTNAALEMLDSKWARQVGQRANRLAEMMRTGIDTNFI